MADLPIADIIELEQLLAKYAVAATMNDVETLVEVFTPDGTYSAFGEVYALDDFPKLFEAAPSGLFSVGTPWVELDVEAGTGTGKQTLLFVSQTDHHKRMGWYTDTYRRTDDGWRLETRFMTFLRRSGAQDSGKAHDPLRPDGTFKAEQ